MPQPTEIEKQLLDTLRKLDQSLRTNSSLPNQNAQRQQSAPRQAKQSAGEDAYEDQLVEASKSFGQLIKRQKELARLTSELTQYSKDEQKNSEEGKKVREEYDKALAENTKDIKEQTSLNLKTYEIQKLAYRQLHEQEIAIKHSVEGMNTLSTALGKAQRSSSLLAASLMQQTENFKEGSAEYSAWINELGESAKGLDVLGKSFLKSAGIVDNITGEMRNNISAKDFAGLRLRLGEAQETISESFAGLEHLGVNGLQDAINKITALSKKNKIAGDGAGDEVDVKELQLLRETLRSTSEKLAEAGVSMGEFAWMFDENGKMTEDAFADLEHKADGLGAHLQNVSDTAAKVAKAQDDLARSAHTATGKFDGFVRALKADPLGFAGEKLAAKFGSTAAVLGGLSKAGEGVKRTWEDIQAFNIAQVPASFMEVQAASVKMGMSFEDTTKFMQENKRTLAIYGSEGFGKIMGQTKDTFAKFGYNMKQAAEVVGPAIEAGISSGIDVRSGDALNKFIDQSMDSFKNISGITNLTAKEYMALNAELLNSKDTAGQLIGMDQERGQAHAKNLIALRDEYTARGLSAQQANELIKIQQQQQREKVTSRVANAAKGAALAASLGMSGEESSRYQQLSLKGNKSKAELDEMQAISNKMGKAMEEQRVNAYDQSTAAGMAKDLQYEGFKPDGSAGEMIDKGVQFAQAERAKTAMTPEEARAAGEKGAGKEEVAKAGNTVNTVASIATNSMTVAVLGAGAALLGFMIQLRGATKLLSGLGGGLGDLLGGGPGGGGPGGKGKGKWGKLLGNAGTMAKGALGNAGTMAKGVLGHPGVFKGAGVLGAVVGAGMAVSNGVSDWNAASEEEEAGTITKEEASKKKGGAVGSAVGGVAGGVAGAAGGALLGAKMGAMLGSIVPGAGTLVGGALGAVVGGAVGFAGSVVGESLGDSIGQTVGGWFGSSDEKKPLPANESTANVTQIAPIKESKVSGEKVDTKNQSSGLLSGLGNMLLPGLGTMVTLGSSVAGMISKDEKKPSVDAKASTLQSSGLLSGLGNMLLPGLGTVATLGSSVAEMFSSKKTADENKSESKGIYASAFNAFGGLDSGKSLADKMLGTAPTGIAAQAASVAAPALTAANIFQPGSQVNPQEINNKSTESQKTQPSDTSLLVNDATANAHLAAIADSLITAITLLQKMADGTSDSPQTTERRPSLVTQPVPTSYAYVTGRT